MRVDGQTDFSKYKDMEPVYADGRRRNGSSHSLSEHIPEAGLLGCEVTGTRPSA
jgi:hypothetical protein